MRRSPLLTLTVFCPHFEKPVAAQRNQVTERLVDCSDKEACVARETTEAGVTIAVYPKGCPVFRQG